MFSKTITITRYFFTNTYFVSLSIEGRLLFIKLYCLKRLKAIFSKDKKKYFEAISHLLPEHYKKHNMDIYKMDIQFYIKVCVIIV